MRLFVRLSLIGLVLLAAAGFWFNQKPAVTSLQPAIKVSDGQCAESGISLVVDFGALKDEIVSKCVEGFSGNSWNLLETAGFELAGTQKYPIGFVCRINQLPGEEVEKCIETPGAKNGSWAFFLAGPDSTNWQYSTFGASSHKVKCGWAEGWRFLAPDDALNTPPRVQPKITNCEK